MNCKDSHLPAESCLRDCEAVLIDIAHNIKCLLSFWDLTEIDS